MTLALLLLAAGLIAGLARGGRLSNLADVKMSFPGLVFAGLTIQLIAEVWASLVDRGLRDRAGIPILVVSYCLLIAFVVMNRKLPGAILIGVGTVLNLAVILANGGMPVSLKAARAAGLDPSAAGFLESAIKRRVMDSETLLWFLGDWIPLPVIQTVVSIGDVVLGIGIFLLVERLVRYIPRRAES